MAVLQILDEGGAGALILHKEGLRAILSVLLKHHLYQMRVLTAPTRDIDKVMIIVYLEPGGTDRIVVNLRAFHCGVPALHDACVRAPVRDSVIEAKPMATYDIARIGYRRLLILGLKGEAS